LRLFISLLALAQFFGVDTFIMFPIKKPKIYPAIAKQIATSNTALKYIFQPFVKKSDRHGMLGGRGVAKSVY